ncbi:hypothetical protein HC031_12865 [Planosporangium thailandense]|uniref:PPE family domain-containing protein n=1 Tax=Planosporangium thailandense TaxID=765197 RepID=A0ABX0XZD4_9ACTN|nr:hypothetical protein [Planosporangium thailandense]NJC70599.1 hypothetical protein [Planosporangium thailandense]
MSGGDYGVFDVKQLYTMVDAAKQGLPQTRAQIQAWQRAEGMLRGHADTLRGYRADLVAQWPPDENAASAAYLHHLDNLLDAVDATANAAGTNARLLDHVAGEIERTHDTVTPLYHEYVANEKKLAAYHAELNAAQAAGGAAGAAAGQVAGGPVAGGLVSSAGRVVGGFLGKGAMELFTSPPVPDGRQAQLNQQARTAMATLAGTAQDASSHMEMPPSYTPPMPGRGGETPHPYTPGGSSGGAVRPPAIAPPAHTRASYTSVAPVGAGTDQPGGADGTSPAPVLSGGTNGPSPVTGPVVGPASQTSNPATDVTAGLTTGLVLGVPSVYGALDGTLRPTTPRAATAEPGLGVEKPVGTRLGPGGRALPPGGVLGGEPGLNNATVRGAGGARRVNPVGGVLGQDEAGVRGGVRPAAGEPIAETGGGVRARGGAAVAGEPVAQAGGGVRGRGGPGVLGGQRRGHGGDDGEERTWDPDNPWAVADGVAPVIEPDEQPRSHDAGPGVIGIDR